MENEELKIIKHVHNIFDNLYIYLNQNICEKCERRNVCSEDDRYSELTKLTIHFLSTYWLVKGKPHIFTNGLIAYMMEGKNEDEVKRVLKTLCKEIYTNT